MQSTLPFFQQLKNFIPIISALKQKGATCYLVGGSVRDLILGRAIKDIDIEVHTVSAEQLEQTLCQFGTVKLVGKQFGVFMLTKLDADWSLPRIDSKGRKPTVEVDVDMGIEKALLRRDITMNAMAIDITKLCDNFDEVVKRLESGESVTQVIDIVDPYGGLEDINKKQLRAVDEKLFLEDPLRFYRVMQFVARFEMDPDEQLTTICKTMDLHDMQTKKPIARERIYEELKKMFLKSAAPSRGFRWLVSIGRLKQTYPEIFALIDTPQREDYHPEGDVFEHTMQALDAAAGIDEYIEKHLPEASSDVIQENKWLLMLAVLCHDFGKPDSTDENLRSHGHDKAGVPHAKSFLKRITDNIILIKAVAKLVEYHMQPLVLYKQGAKGPAYKRLARKLAPVVTAWQLALVALCDRLGRNPDGNKPFASLQDQKTARELDHFIASCEQAQITHGPEESILKGKDLLDVIEPGPQMGKVLDEAYLIQIEEDVKDKEELKRRILKGLVKE